MRVKRTASALLPCFTAVSIYSCEASKDLTKYMDLNYQIRSVSVSRNSSTTTIRYLLIYKGTAPSGIVIALFPGGTGNCHFGQMSEKTVCGKNSSNSIDMNNDIWVSYNFVARNARDFALRGHTVILLDIPFDVKMQMAIDSRGPKIVASAYRVGGDWDNDSLNETEDVVNDLNSVVNDLMSTFSVTVSQIYLVGTSKGTLAAAYLSYKVPSVSGVVLTASVASDGNFTQYCPSGYSDFSSCTGINAYRGKIFIVHHKYDGCSSSSFSSAQSLFNNLSSTQKDFTEINGGINISSDPCKAKTYHGFYGRDADVVNLILDWVEGKTPPPSL